jgi:excisionase family DNA binding protein
MSEITLAEGQLERLADLIAEHRAPPLLDSEQAAELLNVPASWLMAEARAQRIPHVRLGKYVRFRTADLQAWLAGRSVGPQHR